MPRVRPPLVACAVIAVAIAAALPARAQAPAATLPGLPVPATQAPAIPGRDVAPPVAATTPPPALRGTLPAGQATRRPVRRRPVPSYVRPAPVNRAQRPVQGQLARPVERDVQVEVQRPVYGVQAEAEARRRRRQAEEDAYAPTGLRVGSFILRPAVEAGIGWTDNANETATNRIRSAFTRTAAEAALNSDWTQHQLGLRFRYERQDYESGDLEARNTIDAAANFRLDVTRDTRAEFGFIYRLAPDTATTYSLPVTAVGRPDLETRSYTGGLIQRFGRATVSLRGQYDELRYGDTQLDDGTMLSNATRDVNVSTVTLRAGYEIAPAFQPYLEVAANRRDYLISVDLTGLIQGSDGEIYRAGFAFDLGPKLRGEVSGGWLIQRYADPSIPVLQGFAFDGNLAWSITPLTTLRATARTSVLDTASIGAAGGITREFSLSLEHALLRNLLITGTVAYGFDDFAGVARVDERTTLRLAANYRMNRNVSFRLTASHLRYETTIEGGNYNVNTIEGGVRIEY